MQADAVTADSFVSPLLEPLLGVHGAATESWLADAAGTAAERGLGALYSLLFLLDASGQLSCERPASSARLRALLKLHQALGVDLTTLRFDAKKRPAVAGALGDARATLLETLSQVLPLALPEEKVRAAEAGLGVKSVVVAPLHWNGETKGILVLLMPPGPAGLLAHADLLARHAAVALANLREREAGRKRGELDAVRWVYDETRFMEELALEVRRARRHGRPLSVLFLRIQNLPELRVRFGRFLTERVLRQVAGQLAETMRDTDFLGATGEDGLAAILVEANDEGAQHAKQRLLHGLKTMTLPNTNLPGLRVEYVCATATLPQDGESADELKAVVEARLGEGEAGLGDVAAGGARA